MVHASVEFGPRLVGTPTGELRAALLVRPGPHIERAVPLIGEPGAVFARAADQHAVLARTLRFFGVDVKLEESFGDDPRCSAIADLAVLFESGAMLMRPTPMTRRTELDRVESEFSRLDVPIAGRVTAPGLLDGTDVLLVGSTAFVGVGTRGNEIGRSGFASVANALGFRVVEVALAPEVTSLQSVAGAIGASTVVLAKGKVDEDAFSEFETIVLERGEESAAGILCLGERHVIADVRYRTALKQLRRAGVVVEGIDLYDFEKIGITPSMLVLPLRRS